MSRSSCRLLGAVAGVLVLLGIVPGYSPGGQESGYAAPANHAVHGTVSRTVCTVNPASTTVASADLPVIRQRVKALGVKRVSVRVKSATCLVVTAPTALRQSTLLNGILQTGLVAIVDGDSAPLRVGSHVRVVCAVAGCEAGVGAGRTQLKTVPPTVRIVVSSRQVKKGSVGMAVDRSGRTAVLAAFTPAASRAWCAYTRGHVGKFAPTVGNGVVLTDPVIQGAICGGEVQIYGLKGVTEARLIATYLNAGTLPVPLRTSS